MTKKLNVGKSRVIREKKLQEMDRERRIRKGKQKSKK
jgi:hypothetical protein|tara:strand:- start:928 stop:1038 length:111 start_codon:yes stop_codon:yes gene_type:complete